MMRKIFNTALGMALVVGVLYGVATLVVTVDSWLGSFISGAH